MDIQYKKYRKSYAQKIKLLPLFAEEQWRDSLISICKSLDRMPNNCEKFYIALHKGLIVGIAYGCVLPNKTLLPMFLYVIEEYRNQGVAKRLLNKLEHESKCENSLIWYHKFLHDFYRKQNYDSSDHLEIGIKELIY